MSNIKVEAITPQQKRAGGRPQSEGWLIYGFEKVEGPKGKCIARCKKCGNTLKNTSLIRMANHHKRCSCSQVQSVATTVASKVDTNEQEEQIVETVVWESNNVDQYMSEAVTIENVHPAEMEMIPEDMPEDNKHRRSGSSKSQPNFQLIDAHLSSFLIGCNLTFDIVDSSHFKKFVATLNSKYIIPSSSQLKARVISQLHNVDSSGKSKKRRYYDSSPSGSE